MASSSCNLFNCEGQGNILLLVTYDVLTFALPYSIALCSPTKAVTLSDARHRVGIDFSLGRSIGQLTKLAWTCSQDRP